jgi:hypothetical protein
VTLFEFDHRKEAVCQWLVCGWKKEFDDFLKTCCATAASVSADASAA